MQPNFIFETLKLIFVLQKTINRWKTLTLLSASMYSHTYRIFK